MEEKTIVGIASAAGGGIGIIRVSGSESMKIVDSIFIRENLITKKMKH